MAQASLPDPTEVAKAAVSHPGGPPAPAPAGGGRRRATPIRHAAAARVVITLLTIALGSLGLMHWLSGFYERARGGRHGLVILALPGGVHDNRVRLNERHNLPYTPDMAAVYLDEVQP